MKIQLYGQENEELLDHYVILDLLQSIVNEKVYWSTTKYKEVMDF